MPLRTRPMSESRTSVPTKAALTQQYGERLASRSDLYCYFYVRALQLLRERGMHVFVCSNSWLDAQYGEKLQQHLVEHADIRSIFESAVERQFSTAAINTIISIIEKTASTREDETSFVSFRHEFEQAISHPSLRKELRVPKHVLTEARYGQGKWGGKFLRAPSIYGKIIEAASSTNLRLSDFVIGERYLNTGGADGFFILTDVCPAGPGIMKATIRSKEGREHGNPRVSH